MPAPKPDALRKDYEEARAMALDAMAEVDVHEGREDDATALLTEAAGMDPNAEETSELQGQVAYDKHDHATALKDWERALVKEDVLDKRRRAEARELYGVAYGGNATGLDAELDAEYRALFPLPFAPAKPGAVTGGHAVLLELFTGSGCPPCVGGDMAVDGLMEAYPKSQLVALSMDLHIPEPDPLANPDTEGEADVYGVAHTPSYVMDGGMQEVHGGGREDGKELYTKLAGVLDKDAKVAPSVELALTAQMGADGKVTAQAVVSAKDEKAVKAQIAAETDALKPEPKPVVKAGAKAGGKAGAKVDSKAGAAKAAAPVAAVVKPDVPKLQLEFALVEDEVRYSGENGVRFHRMVVRALSPEPATVKGAAAVAAGMTGRAAGGASAGPIAGLIAGQIAKPIAGPIVVEPGVSATVPVAFDPQAISTRLKAYLAEYAMHNDRFGPIEFLSIVTTMDPKHLGVAAWVEDATTHHVLQVAYVPLAVADAKEEAAR
jgi:thiol-disulfide isomerase/thioredoxin